jgi:hypothetical protein
LAQEITHYTVPQLKTALEAGILFKVIPWIKHPTKRPARHALKAAS